MRDAELTERPGKGWTPWAKGPGDYDIEKVWWAARVLHFPKLNVLDMVRRLGSRRHLALGTSPREMDDEA